MPTRSNWKKAAYPHVVKDANITAKNATIDGLDSTDIRVSNIEGTGYLESKKDMVESTGENYSSSQYAGLTISAEAIRYTGGVQLPDLTVDGSTLQQYMQPISFLNSFDGTEEIHGVLGYASQRKSDDPDSSANISTFGLFGAPGENVVLTVSEQEGSMYNYLNSSNQSDLATIKTGIIIDASNRVFMGVNANELYPGGLDLLVKGNENAQLYVKGDIIFDGSGVQVEKYIVDDMFIGSSAAIMGNQLSDDGMNSNDISLSVPNLEKYLEDYEASTGNQGYLFVANTTKLFADLNVSGGVTIGSGNNLDNSGYWASGIETLKINTPFIKDASQVYSGFDSSIYKDGQESDDNLVSRVRHEVYDGKDSALLIQHSNQDEDGNSSQGSLIFLKTNEGAETVTGDVLGAIQFRGVYNSGTDEPQYTQFSTASIQSKQTDTSKNNLIITSDELTFSATTFDISAITFDISATTVNISASDNITFDVSGGDGTIYTQGADIDLSGGNIINVNDISGVDNIIASGDLSFNINSGNGTIYTQGANIDLGGGDIINVNDISGVDNIIASGDLSFNINSGNGTIYTQGASINLDDGDISNARQIRAKHIQVYNSSSGNSYIDFGEDDYEARIIYHNDTRILNFSLTDNLNANPAKMLLIDGSNDTITISNGDLDLTGRDITNVESLQVNNIISSGDLSFNVNSGDGTIYTQGASIDLSGGDISNVENLNGITATEISYLDGVTSNIQTQLDGKQDTLASDVDITTGNITIDKDASNVFLKLENSVEGTALRMIYNTYSDKLFFQLKDEDNSFNTIYQFNDTEILLARQLNVNTKDISGVVNIIANNNKINFDVNGGDGTIYTNGADIDLSGGDISGVNNISSVGHLTFDISNGDGIIYTQGASINLSGGNIENVGDIDLSGGNIINVNDISGVDNIISSGDLSFNVNSGNGTIYTQGDLNVDGTLDVTGKATVDGNLDVTGKATVDSQIILEGDSNINILMRDPDTLEQFQLLYAPQTPTDGGPAAIWFRVRDDDMDSLTSIFKLYSYQMEMHTTLNMRSEDLSGVNNIIAPGDLSFDVSGGEGTIYTNGATIDLSGDDASGGSIVNIKELKSASLPNQSISKIFMVQTATTGIFRMDASANWENGADNTSNDTSKLSTDGKHRLNGTKSGKTMRDEFGRDDDDLDSNGEIIDKYGNGRIIIDYDVDDDTENNNKHFWKFGFGSSSWITFDNAADDGKFYIEEAGFYRISSNIRAINVTSVSSGSVDYIGHNISLGFYISRAASSDDNDYAHEYWDEGICGSFGLIYLNGESHGRSGSTSFSNIYEVTESQITEGENFFCVRTQYSDGNDNSDTTHGYYVSDIDTRHGNSARLWGTTRPCDDFQTWVQLIFEKIN